MTPEQIIAWLNTLNPGSVVCIDDGGLALIETLDGEETGAYLEIGGNE